MNIAFFVSEFPTVTETFIVNQVIDLKKNNHIVDIYTRGKITNIPVHEMIIINNLLDKVFSLDSVPKTRFHKIVSLLSKATLNFSIKNILLLFRAVFHNKSDLSVYDFIPFVGKPDYDVVHAHFGINGKYVAQLKKLGLFKNAKFVTTFHGYDLNEIFLKINFYKDLFEECSSFTVNSNYSKRKLLKLGAPEKEIEILPVGLDVKKFDRTIPFNNPSNSIKLIFVGRLIRLKGPDLFIEICRLLKDGPKLEFRADVIGDGPLFDKLELLINNYNLSDTVILHGNCDQDYVIKLMEQSDVLLMPGICDAGNAETQGLVIQEAQAMQLPVLVSDVGGMAEGIINGVSGFVIPPNELNDFVSKITWLSNHPEKRIEMGRAGRKFVLPKYDINKLNERLIQIYLN